VVVVGRKNIIQGLVGRPPDCDGLVDDQGQRNPAHLGAHFDVRPAVAPPVERGRSGADEDRITGVGGRDRGDQRGAVLDVLPLAGKNWEERNAL
jgi:hypothetical protein